LQLLKGMVMHPVEIFCGLISLSYKEKRIYFYNSSNNNNNNNNNNNQFYQVI